ncbi:hypothetical protein OHB54_02845 [Streptomyces sp. NBC_01007]|nr:hypothetical protein OHB54_02845 [Streptomyces sp. NBC_01007]
MVPSFVRVRERIRIQRPFLVVSARGPPEGTLAYEYVRHAAPSGNP